VKSESCDSWKLTENDRIKRITVHYNLQSITALKFDTFTSDSVVLGKSDWQDNEDKLTFTSFNSMIGLVVKMDEND
jgi:hypothetical protein